MEIELVFPAVPQPPRKCAVCRKCDVPVVIKRPKKRKVKQNQNYYYEYYLFCPICKTMYMVEDAKRTLDQQGNTLFE